ncbi:uncharacterized protein LOC126737433 [Anthonomus grandis grandis]|uniref:uncharacterized protein LOC126737433 n=1 Tax=Anthonomus grandis grandis TaxID=2921223 RepID=UPI0021657CEE|nr:uncharacterized protein LOC126737433 [Anthonomus grandis grandis]
MVINNYCCVFLVGIFVISATQVYCDDNQYPNLNPNWTYCLEYTWIGPDHNNNSILNITCDEYKDTYRLGEDIPCSSPLVISYDGTIPDVEYLWQNHRDSVLCIRAANQVCVTYTYWDKGLIANQTHMCARVKTDSSTMTNGCYKQPRGNYEVEICICPGNVGLSQMPCNSGAITHTLGLMTVVLCLLKFIF